VIFCLGATVRALAGLLQVVWVLSTGAPTPELQTVGRQLGEYAREIALYMSFDTEERPFPFDREWPSG